MTARGPKRGGPQRESRFLRRQQERELVRLEQEYLAASSHPEDFAEIVVNHNYKPPADLDPNASVSDVQMHRLARENYDRAEAFTKEVERAYSTHRGEIPFSWWASKGPDDIRLLGDPNLTDLVKELEAMEATAAEMAKYEKDLNERVQKRYDATHNTWSMIWEFTIGGRDPATRAEIEAEFVEEDARKAGLLDPAEKGFWGTVGGGIGGAFGWTMNQASGLIGGGMEGMDNILNIAGASDPFNTNISRDPRSGIQYSVGPGGRINMGAPPVKPIVTYFLHEAERQAFEKRKEQLEIQLSGSFEDFIRREAAPANAIQWRQFKQDNPQEYNEAVRMAGGEVQAMGMFGRFTETELTSDEQMAQYHTSLEEEQRELIQQLEDKDFDMGRGVLGALQMWNRNVPMRLATGFGLLLTDSDYRTLNVVEGWNKLGEGIEEHDFSLASVWDLDGSLAGLMLDMAGGIAFDPFTYLFGPRGSVRSNGARAAWEADNIAKSPAIGKIVEQGFAHATSAERTAGGLLAMLSGVTDDIGKAQLLDLFGFTNKKLPFRRWKKALHGENADDMLISELDRLPGSTGRTADDLIEEAYTAGAERGMNLEDGWDEFMEDVASGEIDALTFIEGGSVRKARAVAEERMAGVQDLVTDIEKQGLLEPLEITVSRADRTVRLTDGSRRIAALKEMGVERAPVTVRYVDEATTGRTIVSGFDETDDIARGQTQVSDELIDEASIAGAERGMNTEPGWDEFLEDIASGEIDAETFIRGGSVSQARQVATRNLEEAAAKKSPGERLRAIATGQTGVQAYDKGADTTFRNNLLRAAETLHEKMGNRPNRVGTHITRDGEEYSIRMAGRTDQITYYAVDKDNNIVAALEIGYEGASGPATIGIATAEGATRKGLMSKIFDVAGELEDVHPILHHGNSATTSQNAIDFAQNYAKKLIAEKGAKELLPPGLPLDDFMNGRKLVNDLADFDISKGATYSKPQKIFPLEMTIGDVPLERAQEIIGEGIRMRGVKPSIQPRGAMHVAWNQGLRASLKENPLARKVMQWLTPNSTVTTHYLNGPNAVDDVLETLTRLFGDADDLEEFVVRITDALSEQGAAKTRHRLGAAKLDRLAQEVNELRTFVGDAAWDAAEQSIKEKLSNAVTNAATREAAEALENSVRARAAAKQALVAKDRQLRAAHRLLDEEMAQYGNMPQVLQDVLEDAFNHFNRTRLATRPQWKKFVDDDGLVPWDVLQRGGISKEGVAPTVQEGQKYFTTQSMRDMADDLDIKNPETTFQQLTGQADAPVVFNTPLSIVDMLALDTLSGSALKRFWGSKTAHGFKELGYSAHRAWVYDKVFRLSTAGTVSFDELLRFQNIGGWRATQRYLQDRAIRFSARGKAMFHGEGFRLAPGTKYLKPHQQDRIRRLSQADSWMTQAERDFIHKNGIGWEDIRVGESGFDDAARRWTGGMLQDKGFRAFLRGKQDFIDFYQSADGEILRKATAMVKNPKTGKMETIPATAEELYDGWESFMTLVLGHADDPVALRQAFADTAQLIDDAGGVGWQNLPDWAYPQLGVVRGIRRAPKQGPIGRTVDSFFEHTMLNPVNYRRGFLAEMVRGTERARLEALYASQGKRIVSDIAFENMLEMRGLSGLARHPGARNWLHQTALDHGVVLESYVETLIERAVRGEIENTLYAFEKSSRLGRSGPSKAVFPFGKPWADMWGFWGREVMRKPIARGIWHRDSTHLIGEALEKYMPFNPRAAAMISNVANKDFRIDRGLYGEKEGGLLPGTADTDFSPLLFLPSGGDNPFGTMIPGLGFVPMFAIDMYISQIDPVTHPEEWQERVDMFSEFIPSVGFQQGGMVSRLVGGGTAGEVTSNFLNLTSAFSGTSNYSLSSEFFGEIDREIERTRALSAILADEEEWDALFAFNTVEDFNTYLDSIALSADRAATYEQSFLDIARWAVPVSHHGDESVTQLLNVWATAAEMFPESLQARPSLRNADLSNDEQLRAYTDDIRSAFFALDPDERNRLIVQYPQLAINMVSSWRWTNKALEANLPGTDQAYRSTGDRRGRALHQNYVTLNYIRPLDPVERAKRILGTVWNAQEKVGRQVYTDMAGRVNDHLWEKVVTPETRTLLTNILNTGFGERWGFESERELWEKWPTVEKDFELWAAEQQGFVEGSEMFDRVKETINIPGKEKSWGTSWPGLDDQELSKRFKELTINRFPDNVVANAEAIGLELTPGMTGYQLFQGLQGYLSTNNNAAFLASQSVYRNYQQDRGRDASITEEEFRAHIRNPEHEQVWTTRAEEFLSWDGRTRDRYFGEIGGIPLDVQEEAVERFTSMALADSSGYDYQDFWDKNFKRAYGPLDWEAPEPLNPFDENGQRRDTAFQPIIMTLQDGDSMVVKNFRQPGIFGSTLGANQGGDLIGVRLLGVRAPDYASEPEAAAEWEDRLMNALNTAAENGDKIWLVRDPDNYGDHDQYGRMLAWLWIGDEPYYDTGSFRRHQDPSR